MTKGRLEAFSDGVIAIIITITALVINLPEGSGWSDLLGLMQVAGSYTVSFIMVGSNWVNHHHLLQVTRGVSGKILWANLLYLFFLSFIPVSTGWVSKSGFAMVPVTVYVIVNLAVALSYLLLEKAIVISNDSEVLKTALKESSKEFWTLLIEASALAVSFVPRIYPLAFFLLVVAYIPWIIPDIRMKRVYEESLRDQENNP